MVREAFKYKALNSYDIFQVKRWEGKPWNVKLKFLIANYPEMALATFGFLVVVPAILTFQYFTFNREKEEALQKYKGSYTVVRDDDPNIEKIIKLKECGRQYFPK